MIITEALELLSRELTVTYPIDYAPWRRNAQIKLPNQWEVSVSYGKGAYCRGGLDSPSCEVAIFDAEDNWFQHCTKEESSCAGGRTQVFGYVSAELLLQVVDAVSQVHRTGVCPCPNCVAKNFEVLTYYKQDAMITNVVS